MKRQKSATFAKKGHKYTNNKNYRKFKEHCHYSGKNRVAAYSMFNLKYSILRKIPVVFHNGSNYESHLIIKELAKNF